MTDINKYTIIEAISRQQNLRDFVINKLIDGSAFDSQLLKLEFDALNEVERTLLLNDLFFHIYIDGQFLEEINQHIGNGARDIYEQIEETLINNHHNQQIQNVKHQFRKCLSQFNLRQYLNTELQRLNIPITNAIYQLSDKKLWLVIKYVKSCTTGPHHLDAAQLLHGSLNIPNDILLAVIKFNNHNTYDAPFTPADMNRMFRLDEDVNRVTLSAARLLHSMDIYSRGNFERLCTQYMQRVWLQNELTRIVGGEENYHDAGLGEANGKWNNDEWAAAAISYLESLPTDPVATRVQAFLEISQVLPPTAPRAEELNGDLLSARRLRLMEAGVPRNLTGEGTDFGTRMTEGDNANSQFLNAVIEYIEFVKQQLDIEQLNHHHINDILEEITDLSPLQIVALSYGCTRAQAQELFNQQDECTEELLKLLQLRFQDINGEQLRNNWPGIDVLLEQLENLNKYQLKAIRLGFTIDDALNHPILMGYGDPSKKHRLLKYVASFGLTHIEEAMPAITAGQYNIFQIAALALGFSDQQVQNTAYGLAQLNDDSEIGEALIYYFTLFNTPDLRNLVPQMIAHFMNNAHQFEYDASFDIASLTHSTSHMLRQNLVSIGARLGFMQSIMGLNPEQVVAFKSGFLTGQEILEDNFFITNASDFLTRRAALEYITLVSEVGGLTTAEIRGNLLQVSQYHDPVDYRDIKYLVNMTKRFFTIKGERTPELLQELQALNLPPHQKHALFEYGINPNLLQNADYFPQGNAEQDRQHYNNVYGIFSYIISEFHRNHRIEANITPLITTLGPLIMALPADNLVFVRSIIDNFIRKFPGQNYSVQAAAMVAQLKEWDNNFTIHQMDYVNKGLTFAQAQERWLVAFIDQVGRKNEELNKDVFKEIRRLINSQDEGELELSEDNFPVLKNLLVHQEDPLMFINSQALLRARKFGFSFEQLDIFHFDGMHDSEKITYFEGFDYQDLEEIIHNNPLLLKRIIEFADTIDQQEYADELKEATVKALEYLTDDKEPPLERQDAIDLIIGKSVAQLKAICLGVYPDVYDHPLLSGNRAIAEATFEYLEFLYYEGTQINVTFLNAIQDLNQFQILAMASGMNLDQVQQQQYGLVLGEEPTDDEINFAKAITKYMRRNYRALENGEQDSLFRQMPIEESVAAALEKIPPLNAHQRQGLCLGLKMHEVNSRYMRLADIPATFGGRVAENIGLWTYPGEFSDNVAQATLELLQHEIATHHNDIMFVSKQEFQRKIWGCNALEIRLQTQDYSRAQVDWLGLRYLEQPLTEQEQALVLGYLEDTPFVQRDGKIDDLLDALDQADRFNALQALVPQQGLQAGGAQHVQMNNVAIV